MEAKNPKKTTTAKVQLVDIGKVKPNTENPRIILGDKLEKLKNSLKSFPQMMEIRPIVVNSKMEVLGGNMRLRAAKEIGLKKIHIIKADELTEEQQKEFTIKDNVGFGEWDWDLLETEWDKMPLKDWGLDVWQPEEDVDYSMLDDDDLLDDLEDMKNGVKKAIQIPFNLEHYEEASELVKFWRNEKAYVGGMIIEYLKSEKEKFENNRT